MFELLLAANPTKLDIVLLVGGTTASILYGILLPIQSIIYGQLADEMKTECYGTDHQELCSARIHKAQPTVLVSLAGFLVAYIYLACWGTFGHRLVQRLQQDYFRAVLHQDVEDLASISTGDIFNAFHTDIEVIRAGVDERLGSCIMLVTFISSMYAVSFWQTPSLAWKMTALLPLYFVSARLCPEYTNKLSKVVDQSISRATNLASECLQNMHVVHAFHASERLKRLYAARVEQASTAIHRKVVAAALQSAVLYAVAYGTNGVAIWQGSKELSKDDGIDFRHVQNVVSCFAAGGLAYTHVAPFLTSYCAAVACFNKLVKVTASKRMQDFVSTGGTVHLSEAQSKGDFELCHVSCRHHSRPDSLVLNCLSLKIPGGCKTAIVGPSGAGKSTIASLLCCMENPTSGNIQLDGGAICDYDLRSVRCKIAVVEQDAVLFDCSIFENVAYGFVGITNLCTQGELQNMVTRVCSGSTWREVAEGSARLQEIVYRVQRALNQAQAYEFVLKLEHGIATNAKDRLSGGQKQRIALARALARDTPILILDESFSAIDLATEQDIQRTLQTTFKKRTIISITHRLQSLRDYDKIVVIDNGKLAEEGTYDELADSNGHFARMLGLQSSIPGCVAELTRLDRQSQPALTPASGLKRRHSLMKGDVRLARHPTHTAKPQLSGEHTTPEVVVQAAAEKKEPQRKSPTLQLFCSIYSHTPHLLPQLLIGTFVTIFVGISCFVESVLLAGALDDTNRQRFTHAQVVRSSWQYLVTFLALGGIFSGAEFIRTYIWKSVSESTLVNTRLSVLHRLLDNDMSWHDKYSLGTSHNFLTVDTVAVGHLTDLILARQLESLSRLATTAALAFVVSWKTSLILVLSIPLSVLVGIVQTRTMAHHWGAHYHAFAASVNVAKGALEAIRVVVAFQLEGTMLESFQDSMRQASRAMEKKIIYSDLFLALSLSIRSIVRAIGTLWGLKLVLDGHTTMLQFHIACSLIACITDDCGQIAATMNEISHARGGAAQAMGMIDEAPASDPHKTSGRRQPGGTRNAQSFQEASTSTCKEPRRRSHQHGASVTLHGVKFAYPHRPQKQVLKDLSMLIPCGTICALVGPSGSGKSTIINLIEGIYEPSKGSVTIDGNTITMPGRSDPSLRQDMSLVPQESMLFNDTVRFNLNIGSPHGVEDTPHEELVQAADNASIHSTIGRLREAYDTPCGAMGRNFSGGQRQRLSLARALVRRPRILLLDEHTSMLDAVSASAIRDSLETLKSQTTTVMVTHRLNDVRKADMIFVIDDGRCVDRGTHQELIERNEWYRRGVLLVKGPEEYPLNQE